MEGLTKIVGDFVGKGCSVAVDLAVKCLRLFRQVKGWWGRLEGHMVVGGVAGS